MGIDAITGEGDKGVRVTDLVVPQEQERDFVFDPKRDISEETWLALKDSLTAVPKKRDVTLLNLLPVFPERREFFDPDGTYFRDQVATIVHNTTETDMSKVFFSMMRFKLSYPDYPFTVPPQFFTTLMERGQEYFASEAWWEHLFNTYMLSVFFPERKAEFSMGESDIENIISEIQKLHRGTNQSTVLTYAAYLSLLYPEQKRRLPLDEKFWRANREDLDTFLQTNNMGQASFSIFFLSVLGAEKAWIDERGYLKIIPREEPLTDTIQNTPEVRKF